MSADSDRLPPDFWIGVAVGFSWACAIAFAWWAAHRIEAIRALLPL